MSYPQLNELEDIDNLLKRKEFYSLKADPVRNFRDPPEGRNDPIAGKYLKIHSHQLFVRNFMNPDTPYRRLHLLHVMGSGKTLAACSIAQEFIKVYKKIYATTAAKSQAGRRNHPELANATPTVFVLGFSSTRSAFTRELLKHPEFGFISLSERDELIKRQKIAAAGLPDDIKNLKEFYSHLKKRITNKSKDGFYQFFGYDEFVNRLFLSDDVKLTDLEALAIQKLRAGENVTLEDIFYEHIRAGKIQVNHNLLARFDNSLMICDEIHNTYNMNMKNNRGVSIQFILDSVPSLRFLSLSATPINNSPTEAVELLNYLVPPEKKITKKAFFANFRNLNPGKLEEIGKLSRGKISFLQDINIKYFPKRIFLGESLKIPKKIEDFAAGSTIPYLKFIACPMSEFHQKTYNHYVRTSALVGGELSNELSEELSEESPIGAPAEYHSIPTDGYSIYDIAFPNPESSEYGLFRSSEVKNKISLADQAWRDEKKISVKKFSAINSIITGDFLERDTIAYYSTKCATLLDELKAIISESNGNPHECQKIMIYHGRVKMSGVLLLQELLRANNFLDEYSEPVDSTICCICGAALSAHSGVTEHVYRPARFVVAHSDVDKVTMEQSLAKFNSPDNVHGLNYMILIGSKIIKESYDFKSIQNQIIMAMPTNIPTLLQVLGRCIRKNSHIDLPPEQRQVKIRILISTVNSSIEHVDSVSPEMYRWVEKLSDYIVIQNIEREFNRNAIDANIHRDIIMPQDLRKEYFPEGAEKPVAMLGNLYFDPVSTIPQYTLGDLTLSTFNAYKHYEEEIRTITYIIKRLFIRQPVWTYEDLWAAVREPPVGVEVNPGLFLENNFIIALHNLINSATTIISASKHRHEMTETMLIERLFDSAERYIYIGGRRHKIEQIDRFYILFPVSDLPVNPLNVVYTEYVEHVRDKERAMIKELTEPNDRPLIDVETYLRAIPKRAGARINVDTFVRESKENINYVAKKKQFIDRYGDLDDVSGFLSDFSAQFQMNFVEESIIFFMLGKSAVPAEEVVYKLYAKVVELLDRFRVIVHLKEVMKYKDTAKQFKNGVPALDETMPIGYMSAKSVRLFDPQVEIKPGLGPDVVGLGKWVEVSKIALNRHTSFKENDIIVGYLESAEDYMRFKLRKPVHKIKEDVKKEARERQLSQPHHITSSARTSTGDIRLIERGIVCSTKNKHDLLYILASLGVSVSKLEKSDIRIRKLCDTIKKTLIEREIKERQRDSRIKYLYGWWDEAVDIAARI